MTRLGLETEIIDRKVYDNTVKRFREADTRLPTFAQLAEPEKIPEKDIARLSGVDPDAPNGRNLFRNHWHNGPDRRDRVAVPAYLSVPESITGVPNPILMSLGDRFPLISTHKVLAAYACLAPRLITGQFDPTQHKAVWPSTGNYCRGGVAISRIMGCRGVAILPEGMSEERFRWLEDWVMKPEDTIPTVGSESNVKEIYDKCAELEVDPTNVIFNQFCEFGNHLAHYLCTGIASDRIFEAEVEKNPNLRLAAFVSATGSAGTIGAGDYLKDKHGSLTVAVEALECPTMLYNGYGEHNIQGIGDKHIPLIHNVMNNDVVTAISDRSTDSLNVLFNTDAGRAFLRDRRGIPAETVAGLGHLGLSSICNLLAAIKVSKYYGLGPDDVVVTVATDSAAMYDTEVKKAITKLYPKGFDTGAAEGAFREHLLGMPTDHLLELTKIDRERIFNLGYYTWVEQQGVTFEEFVARKHQSYWRKLRDLLPTWDGMIDEFNGRTGVARD